MSVREEDRQKGCSNRGLGIAAAAIGVGVGAALYYFFNKRSENPDGEGSTSNWPCEEPHPLLDHHYEDDDSFTTISEHSTTDTSINSSETNLDTESYTSESDTSSDSSSDSTVNETDSPYSNFDEFMSNNSMNSDLEREWDVTTSSIDVPFQEQRSPMLRFFEDFRSAYSPRPQSRPNVQQQNSDQAFRERSWSLEECSICFDVMLRNQEVVALPCTHRFHQPCILPWLQERQTCPMCRKAAECMKSVPFYHSLESQS